MKQISKRTSIIFHVIGFLIGILLGTFLVFQVLFLYRVIPHGGI